MPGYTYLLFFQLQAIMYFLKTTVILNYSNILGFDFAIFDFCFSWKAGKFELWLCLGDRALTQLTSTLYMNMLQGQSFEKVDLRSVSSMDICFNI